MKLCWGNIENIRLTKKGNFRDIVNKRGYEYHDRCECCNLPFLGKKGSKTCSKGCSNSIRKHTEETKRKIGISNSGRIVTDETRRKLSKINKGRKFTDEHKRKISESNRIYKGKDKGGWKGGYTSNNIPRYDTYAPQIEWCEEVRRNDKDSNVLEVKCFKCDNWFIPKLWSVKNRIQCLRGNHKYYGRFYCSDKCKHTCFIWNKSPETLMKEDALRSGRLNWLELEREVQPELRQMVLERDNNECVKCGSNESLHCHHILPVNIEPLLSADIDNCITLCKDCHIKVHKQDGCQYNQLYIKEC